MEKVPTEIIDTEAEGVRTNDTTPKEHVVSEKSARLIVLWRTHWKGTQTGFAKLYGVNEGNFSRWLLGKRDCRAAEEAILLWLKNNRLLEENNIKEETNSPNLPALASVLKQRLQYGGIVFLIDGDNAGQALKHLYTYIELVTSGSAVNCPYPPSHLVVSGTCPHETASLHYPCYHQCRSVPSIHGVYFLARAHAPHADKVEEENKRTEGKDAWVTYILSATALKEATDHAISCTTSYLVASTSLCSNTNNICYVIVTNDYFARETAKFLSNAGTDVCTVNSLRYLLY